MHLFIHTCIFFCVITSNRSDTPPCPPSSPPGHGSGVLLQGVHCTGEHDPYWGGGGAGEGGVWCECEGLVREGVWCEGEGLVREGVWCEGAYW